MANFNESNTLTFNIYTDASSKTNGTTIWACFMNETDKEIRDRILNHTHITLAGLNAFKVAEMWISSQTFHERSIIHSDFMGALAIISSTNFHTYPKIFT